MKFMTAKQETTAGKGNDDIESQTTLAAKSRKRYEDESAGADPIERRTCGASPHASKSYKDKSAEGASQDMYHSHAPQVEQSSYEEDDARSPGAYAVAGVGVDSPPDEETGGHSLSSWEEAQGEQTVVVEAHKVTEPPLAIAQSESPHHRFCNKFTLTALCSAIAAIAALVAVLVLVVFNKDNNGSEILTTPPTTAGNNTSVPTTPAPNTTSVVTTEAPPLPVPRWEELGERPRGISGSDALGYSVALSDDGSIMAVGAEQICWDCQADETGYVQVYSMSGTDLVLQTNQELKGDAPGDSFGRVVKLSGDGLTLAVGANEYVRLFQYGQSSWNRVGGTDLIGSLKALSSDGRRILIGVSSEGVNTLVQVYQLSGDLGGWEQVGQDIPLASEDIVDSGAFASNGDTITIGVAEWNTGGAGYAQLYQLNGTEWNMLEEVVGERQYDDFGSSVALSADGSVWAVGAQSYGDSDLFQYWAGLVRVFLYDGVAWKQHGKDLMGESEDDFFGSAISLDADGTRMAVGAPQTLVNDNGDPGYVMVYEYEDAELTWIQLGQTIRGDGLDDWLGNDVALSGDGNILAIGSPHKDSDTTRSVGEARAYELYEP